AVGRLVELLGLHRGHVRAAGGRERQAQGCGGEHGTAGTAHGGLLFDAAERRGRTGAALTEYPKAGPPGRPGHRRDRDEPPRERRTGGSWSTPLSGGDVR